MISNLCYPPKQTQAGEELRRQARLGTDKPASELGTDRPASELGTDRPASEETDRPASEADRAWAGEHGLDLLPRAASKVFVARGPGGTTPSETPTSFWTYT